MNRIDRKFLAAMLIALVLVFGMTIIGCDQATGPENQQGSEQPAEAGVTYVGATDDNTPVELVITGGTYTIKVGGEEVSSGTAAKAADGTWTLQPEGGEPFTATAGEDGLTIKGPITEGLDGKDLYELYPAEAPPPDGADYSVSLNAPAVHVFPSKAQGYEKADVKALSVLITNTGKESTGELTVALSETNSGSFTLSTETIADIAAEKKKGFTVKPNLGLKAGIYTAKATVSSDNISASFRVRFTVNNADGTPPKGDDGDDEDGVYGIALDVSGEYIFEDAVAGYEEPEPLEVAVINTGTAETGELSVVLGGPNEGSFTVTQPNPSSLEKEDDTACFTVVPNTGLAEGTYTAKVSVSGDNDISAEFDVSFEVTATYGISLSEKGPLVFDEAVFGYPAQEPQAITISNTGDQPTGALTVKVSTGDFTLDQTTIANIAVEGEAEFTVVPKGNLAVGTHTATVTVSGGNNITAQSFGVSFEVIEFSPSYLTLTGGATVTIGRADLDALCTGAVSTDSITVNGQSIVKDTIVGAVFGSDFIDVPALPDKFCRFFTNLTALDISGFTNLTSLGADFLFDCSAFNQPLVLPESLTAIADGFLYGCAAFNQPLELPERLTAIGEGFLVRCSAFNRPVTIPAGVTTIEGAFMSNCTVFNQPLTLPPGITSVGDSFLADCEAFNRPVDLPSATDIGMNFMYDCAAFNESLTITSVTTIGKQFLYRCSLFNQPLALPSSLTAIDLFFMRECHAFNRPLTIPATVTSIGHGFVMDCRNMTSTITINCPASAFTASDYTGYNFATSNAEAPCYTTGMTIAGPYAASIIARFPTGTAELMGATHYRKVTAASGD